FVRACCSRTTSTPTIRAMKRFLLWPRRQTQPKSKHAQTQPYPNSKTVKLKNTQAQNNQTQKYPNPKNTQTQTQADYQQSFRHSQFITSFELFQVVVWVEAGQR